MSDTTILTWIDLETTGLRPPSSHRILEYAVVLTDLELKELASLTAVIPQNVKLSEAQSHGKAIFDYDFKCKGAVAYMKLAREVIKKGEL